MKIVVAALTIGAGCLFQSFAGEISSIAALSDAIYRRHETGKAFDIMATATTSLRTHSTFFTVEDNGSFANIVYEPVSESGLTISAGDRLRIVGSVKVGKISHFHYASCTGLTVVAHGRAPDPTDVSIDDMLSGKYDNRLVRMKGLVRDVFADEIDTDYYYMTLSEKGEVAYVTFFRGEFDMAELRKFIASEIQVTGACYPFELNTRRQIGRIFHATADHPISIVGEINASPFDVEALADYPELRPSEISRLGQRKVSGRVIAFWQPNNLLIEDSAHRKIGVTTIEGPHPKCGEGIEAVGFPASDLYRVNLTHAIWRPKPSNGMTIDSADEIDIDAILSDSHDGFRYRPDHHGRCISLTGTLLNLPGSWETTPRLHMKCGRHIVPVDVSSCPNASDGLSVGSIVKVTGICVMETENWQPFSAFPRIKGFFVVARTAEDLEILSLPPWWTPARLLILIGVLMASLVGFTLWNRQLKHAVEAKGRELEHEIVERIGSDFKVEERTRLAVELHDSLSQTLTGIAMKINAANRAMPPDGAIARKHLDLAARALASCRGELKNCLWDLRNNALEDKDMGDAVRRIVTPHIGDTKLSVRFASLRDRFTDSTTHTILRIIRELATNAVRHGHASHVQIAGTVEDGMLKISVRDDGCGFDVSAAPGMELGHFGLEGIRERLRKFNGILEIDSSPGGGTRAVVSLVLPSEKLP